MDEREDAYREYVKLAMEARRLEAEMLGISATSDGDPNVDAHSRFTVEDRPKLINKLKELKSIEGKRDKAHQKFVNLLWR